MVDSSNRCIVIITLASLFASVAWYKRYNPDSPNHNHESESCAYNHQKKLLECRLSCDKRFHFSLAGMQHCHPWLSCNDYDDIDIQKLIGSGFTKNVYLASWRSYKIAVQHLNKQLYREDFLSGIVRHKQLHPSPFISQFIGQCNDSFLTEFYPWQNLGNLETILKEIPSLNNPKARLLLCINYVEILEFLHNHPSGPFFTCDANSVRKISLQYLIAGDFRLVLNDVDALPMINNSGAVCGKREPVGDAVAPEQMWTNPDKDYNYTLMQPYDQKVDIWRVPNVCNYILGNSNSVERLKFALIRTFIKCKELDPHLRPNATSLLKSLNEIFNTFFL